MGAQKNERGEQHSSKGVTSRPIGGVALEVVSCTHFLGEDRFRDLGPARRIRRQTLSLLRIPTSTFPSSLTKILQHTVRRTWLFIAMFMKKMIILKILATSLIHVPLKRWENVLFELGSERVKKASQCHSVWDCSIEMRLFRFLQRMSYFNPFTPKF